jgi:hypothetical protein
VWVKKNVSASRLDVANSGTGGQDKKKSHKNNPSEKVQVQAAQIQTNRLQTVQVFKIYTSLGYK